MSVSLQRSAFLRHLGAYVASEAVAKISRLGVVLVVARTMDLAAIGLAAAALASGEIIKALTENGVGQQIIRAPQSELDAVCRTAHSIAWVWCLGLMVLQCLAAGIFWMTGGDALIALMLVIMAGEYLFMPGGIVQCALANRRGHLTATAAVAGGQIVAANIATIVLVMFWHSPIAIVLPKLLSAPIWLIGMRRINAWRREAGASAPLRPFVSFGSTILAIEALKAIRLHADKLVIGGLLGAEALGVWFFAINAGLGLATSFAQAFSVVLFPHLCAAEDRRAALGTAMLMGLAVMAPVVVAQSALAPIYVPLLFGERWADSADLVAILCLAALPALIWSATAQWLRSTNRAGVELSVTALLGVLTVLCTAIFAQHGLEALAWATVATAVLVQVGATIALTVPARPRTEEI